MSKEVQYAILGYAVGLTLLWGYALALLLSHWNLQRKAKARPRQ